MKAPLSIKVLYILTSIIYYLSIAACSLGFLLATAIATGLIDEGLQLHVDMPLEVNVEEVGTASFDNTEMEIQIVEAVGKVHFIDTYPRLARRLAIPLLVIFPYLLGMIFLFHRFIRNVREGRTFELQNFKYLRMLGYSLLGLWFLMVIYMQIFRYTVVSQFQFETLEITQSGRWFGGILLGALLTLVLAHVFLKGRELEEETALTI